MIGLNQYEKIDGVRCPALALKQEMGAASFINAVEKSDRRRNCKLRPVRVTNTCDFIFAIATRDIKVGEELLTSYGSKLALSIAMNDENYMKPRLSSKTKTKARLADDKKSHTKLKTRALEPEPSSAHKRRTVYLEDADVTPSDNPYSIRFSREWVQPCTELAVSARAATPKRPENGILLLPDCLRARDGCWELDPSCAAGECVHTHRREWRPQNVAGCVVFFSSGLAHKPEVGEEAVCGLQVFFTELSCDARVCDGALSKTGTRSKTNMRWHLAADFDPNSCAKFTELKDLLLEDWHSPDLRPFRPKGTGRCLGTDIKSTTLKLPHAEVESLVASSQRYRVLLEVLKLVQAAYEVATGKKTSIGHSWINMKLPERGGSCFGGHYDVFPREFKHDGTASLPLGSVSDSDWTRFISSYMNDDSTLIVDDVSGPTGTSRAHAHAHAHTHAQA
jgi:hypothetical protein